MTDVRILTFNLGTRVMSNQVQGTEAPLVQMCQNTYNGGWHDNTISQCTYNAAQLISQYDLFGLQEVNPQYESGLLRAIQAINSNYRFISGYNIITGYNYNITGEGIPLTNNTHKIVDRGLQVIWFPKLRLLFINLHAPHHIDLIGEIHKSLASVIIPQNVRYIVMLGDFNDHQRVLLNTSLMLFNVVIALPNPLLTCCTDNNYTSSGDYILTNGTDITYYGYPQGYIRGQPLMSDHDPVALHMSLK